VRPLEKTVPAMGCTVPESPQAAPPRARVRLRAVVARVDLRDSDTSTLPLNPWSARPR